jgi:urate oxidase
MSVRLTSQIYGKSSVRLTKVTRRADRHELIELNVDVALEGDFSESYTVGDNRRVVATDTMKNTVYALAADHPAGDPESFALALTKHFLDRNAHVTAANVAAAATPWQRIVTDGKPHRHSFVGGGQELRTCRVRRTRTSLEVVAGLTGLPLLKTTDSAFKGFPRDEFTTLPETDDRIFATLLEVEWTYSAKAVNDPQFNWNDVHDRLRTAMIDVFADHKSLAVQQTLYAMGEATLAECSEVTKIALAMPNQHRIPFNLAPLGKENKNEIFVTTSEPYGRITAVLERG